MHRTTCAAMCALVLSTTAGAQARTGTVEAAGGRLYYETSGRGRAIVLIHGWALNLGAWDEQVPAFAPRFRVVRYDLRGFGKSTGHSDVTGDADDLRILMDSLGIRSAYLVGLSRGATIAKDFTARWPDRVAGLVLHGMPPTEDFLVPPGSAQPPFAEIARQHGMDSLRKFIAGSPLAWHPPDRPDLDAKLWKTLAAYEGRDLLDPRPPSGRVPSASLADLARLRVPTLIVNGDHELPLLLAVADTLALRIPGARKVVIANAGHGSQFTQPEEFNRVVLDFLTSLEP